MKFETMDLKFTVSNLLIQVLPYRLSCATHHTMLEYKTSRLIDLPQLEFREQ